MNPKACRPPSAVKLKMSDSMMAMSSTRIDEPNTVLAHPGIARFVKSRNHSPVPIASADSDPRSPPP
jgi:hypothetical protein